jgi:hypothetical protein
MSLANACVPRGTSLEQRLAKPHPATYGHREEVVVEVSELSVWPTIQQLVHVADRGEVVSWLSHRPEMKAIHKARATDKPALVVAAISARLRPEHHGLGPGDKARARLLEAAQEKLVGGRSRLELADPALLRLLVHTLDHSEVRTVTGRVPWHETGVTTAVVRAFRDAPPDAGAAAVIRDLAAHLTEPHDRERLQALLPAPDSWSGGKVLGPLVRASLDGHPAAPFVHELLESAHREGSQGRPRRVWLQQRVEAIERGPGRDDVRALLRDWLGDAQRLHRLSEDEWPTTAALVALLAELGDRCDIPVLAAIAEVATRWNADRSTSQLPGVGIGAIEGLARLPMPDAAQHLARLSRELPNQRYRSTAWRLVQQLAGDEAVPVHRLHDRLVPRPGRAADQRTEVQRQLRRLEDQWLDDPTWPADEWAATWLVHPVLAQVAERVLWDLDGRPCGVETGALLDLERRAVVPRGTLRLLHPVRHDGGTLRAWAGWIALPGLRQLDRPVYRPEDPESGRSELLRGRRVNLWALQRVCRGTRWTLRWHSCGESWVSTTTQDHGLRLALEPRGAPDDLETTTLHFRSEELSPVTFSEALHQLDGLLRAAR